MGQHYLRPLFAPKSVAVFGASDRIDSIGQIVFQNMLQSGFQGALYPINPKNPEVQGCKAYSSIAQINAPVELAVIATPPRLYRASLRNAVNITSRPLSSLLRVLAKRGPLGRRWRIPCWRLRSATVSV